MAIAHHTHTFTIPTADAADITAGTENDEVVTPAVLGPITAAGKALMSAADAAAQRAALDLEPGTDVQAYDADLSAIAALAKTDGNIIAGNGSEWVAKTGAEVRAITDEANIAYGGQWTDGATWGDSPNSPRILRHRDPVFLGLGADMSGARSTTSYPSYHNITSVFPGETETETAGYALRDGWLTVFHPRGGFAIVGVSKTSDVGTTSQSTGALNGFTVTDAAGKFSRTIYAQADLTADANGTGTAAIAEFVMKNSDPLATDFSSATSGSVGGVGGLSFIAGGDPADGIPQAPADYAIAIAASGNTTKAIATVTRVSNVVTATFASTYYALVAGTSFTVAGVTDSSFDGTFVLVSVATNKLSATWAQVAADATSSGGTLTLTDTSNYRFNSGIIMRSAAFLDSETYEATGIDLGLGVGIDLGRSALGRAARIHAETTNNTPNGIWQVFTNGGLVFRGLNGSDANRVFLMEHLTGGANYVRVRNAASGAFPAIKAVGPSDANIELAFESTGATGVARFTDGSGNLAAYITSSSGTRLAYTNSSPNTVFSALQIRANTTAATPAAGIGVSMAFDVVTAPGNVETGARIEAVATSVTSTAEAFDLVLKTMSGGATAAERMRLTSAGALILRPPSSAPALGTNGELTIEATSNTSLTFKLRGSDGTTRSGSVTLA